MATTSTQKWTVKADSNIASPSYGSGKDPHLVAGSEGGSSENRRALILFNKALPPSYLSVASATLYLHNATGSPPTGHDTPDVGAQFYIERLTASFTEGTYGSDHAYYGSNSVTWANAPSTAGATNRVTGTYGAQGAWSTYNVLAMVNAMLADDVAGVLLRAVSIPSDLCWDSKESAYDPYISVVFNTNNPPTEVITVPDTSAAILAGVRPTFKFVYSDPDGDNSSQYRGGVYTNLWALVTQQTVASVVAPGTELSWTCNADLTRGTTYFLKTDVWDSNATMQTATVYRSFIPNRLPTCTLGFAVGQVLEPAYVGGNVRPMIRWTYSDPDGRAQTAYQVKVYSDLTGSPSAPLWDSGKVTGANGAGQFVVAPINATNGQYLHIKVRVWDDTDDGAGEPSIDDTTFAAVSAFTRVRMRWGVASYRKDLSSAPSSWTAPALTNQTGATSSVLVEWGSDTALNASPASGWLANFSDVPLRRYLYYRVWLFAWGSASPTTPKHSKSALTVTSSSAVWVDGWTRSDNSRVLTEYSDHYYGTQALRVSANGSAEAYAKQTVKVMAGLPYTLSGRIKSSGNSQGRIQIRDGADTTTLAETTILAAATDWTSATVSLASTGSATSLVIRCYVGATGVNGTYALFDALKLEQGTVSTPWTPSFVGDAVTVDAGGVMVDGSAGGVFRLVGANYGSPTLDARAAVALGTRGLLYGGDTEVFSPIARMVSIDGATLPRGVVSAAGGAGTAGQYVKMAHGVIAAQYGEATFCGMAQGFGQTTAAMSKAMVSVRVKQQAALASAPVIEVTAFGTAFLPGDFALVITANSGALTSWEFYVKSKLAYETIGFTALLADTVGTGTTLYLDEASAFGAALPTDNRAGGGGPTTGVDWSFSSLSVAGALSGGSLSIGANKVARYVSLGGYSDVVAAATYTSSDSSAQVVEVTSVPTSGVVAIVVQVLARSDSAAGSNAVFLLDYASTTAAQRSMTGYAGAVAGYYAGGNQAIVIPGGTNGRQIKYWRNWNAGTVTFYIQCVGYWTTS